MDLQEREQILAVADQAATSIKEMIIENIEEINDAIQKATDDAQEKEMDTGTAQTVKVALNHKILVNLTALKQFDSLSWSVAHKCEMESTMEDKNQTKLPL